ncbi:MAG: response regulator, partial [Acidiferrobacterales bacterium]
DLTDENLTGIEVEEVATTPVVQAAPQFETAAPLGQVKPVTAPTTTPEAAPGKREQIRVRTDLLDTLANYAGEVSISRARMEQQIFGFRENLGELDRNVVRFRAQLRDLEIQSESQILARAEQEGIDNIEDFDPLEFDRFSKLQQLSRSLTESLHDLTSIQGSLGNFASEAETVLHQQARVNTDLQEGLMRTRLVSFSTQSTRLRHIVRQTSREVDKQAQFEIVGAEVELDRNVLERMIGPFEHMIRNSLDHGIESAKVRRKKGKPASGKIRIETTQQGSEIVILFSDDGSGLNIEAIRNKAIERGLISADSKLSNEEITQFILMSGFSTAEKITAISGRGVGMDVVHNEVRQLGGAMSVETEPDKGTTFVIRLPLTLSITQALMVYIGEQLYATPLSGIVNILEVPISEMEKISLGGDEPVFNFGDHDYPFMHLGARLEVPSVPRNPKKVPVLLVKSGSRTVAIQVDGLAGTKEIVIKNVGPLVGEVRGISGATILGDGTVVLILDVPDLWVSDDLMHVAHVKAPAVEVAGERTAPLVMVVDDSLTVRKITSRHLLKKGMECLTAKDGLDALEQLRDHRPDVMLVDIEMPRMDGYELTQRIRATRNLKDIPIIMITSRAGKKHKDKAFGLGVDDYMSKPYQQEQLFENIERLIKEGRKP